MPALPFTSPRQTIPDRPSLLAALQGLDPTAWVQFSPDGAYVFEKATAWTAPQIAAAQNALDTAPAATPQLTAQAEIDRMSIFEKAIVLTILDQFNVVRSKLAPPLPDITVAQMIAAIRAKAGTL